MLDALVVAPHPDDAELGVGGTIVRLIGQGWRVGILDLTSGEPTPLGSLRAPGRGDGGGEPGAGGAVAEEPRPAEPESGADPGEPPRPGRRVSRDATPAAVRALLGGCPPRSHGRDPARRGGPVLVEALEERHPRRRRSTRRGSSITSASTCGSSSARACCSTSPTSSTPRSRRCAAIARNWSTTSPRAGPA